MRKARASKKFETLKVAKTLRKVGTLRATGTLRVTGILQAVGTLETIGTLRANETSKELVGDFTPVHTRITMSKCDLELVEVAKWQKKAPQNRKYVLNNTPKTIPDYLSHKYKSITKPAGVLFLIPQSSASA